MTMSNEEALEYDKERARIEMLELFEAWKELDEWDEERCPTCGCVESGCHEIGCLSDEWEDGE